MSYPAAPRGAKRREAGGVQVTDVIISTVKRGLAESEFDGALGMGFGARRTVKQR